MKAAIYLRVSTKDKGQDTENQRLTLTEACKRWGYEIVRTYSDNESGGKGRKARAEFDQMFRDAERKQFDIVVFWSLDRFTREGINETFEYLRILDAQGVGFRSLQEPYLNTDNELVKHILITCMSYFAAYERKRMSDRIKAGMARKMAEGWEAGEYGRKVLSKKNRQAANDYARALAPIVQRIRAEGHKTIMAVCEELNRRGIDTPSGKGVWHISTTHKYLKRIEELA